MTIFLIFGKEKIMNKLKLIKFAVVIMTFLIVFGSLLMLTTLYKKINKKPVVSKQDIHLNEPAESRINSILEHGRYIYIVVKDGGIPDRIVVFDPESGTKVSTIRLN